MRGLLTAILTIALIAVGVGSTLAYFSDTEISTGTFTTGTLDLKIRDQDELWGDGVTGTWIASEMKPGDTFNFYIPFVQLAKVGKVNPDHLEITCDYVVIEEAPNKESDTDPKTNQNPDKMAKEIIVKRAIYRNDEWCIDFLTGKKYDGYDVMTYQCTGNIIASSVEWQIEDQDGDGKITFYDLKHDELNNLPPPLSPTTFEMSVKFNKNAGNDFQGDTFNLDFIFTLKQDSSQ